MAEGDTSLTHRQETTPASTFFSKVVRPVLAEFIGTTLFVFSVCLTPGDYSIASSLLQGFAYVVLIVGLGKFSGGHFNPAITSAVALCGGVSLLSAVCYIIAQLVGGLIGAALVLGILSERDFKSRVGGATMLRSGTEPGWGVLTEAILTFMLILTVLMTTIDEKKHKLAPLAIGFAVTVGVMAGGPVTGGSMNPARNLGPIVSTAKYHMEAGLKYHYIYWVGPIVGLLIATLIYRLIFDTRARQRKNPYIWIQNSRSESPNGDMVLN
ncbi:aquaporin-8-like isoform X2 [Saccostrea cucullata]|uniref:aquaporin-8-like isoform X2 n=1 Tax=Saccostrea cuccullata TaxID=36930 RepID=UPI002ED0944A